jgi:hypothetical protein
MAERTSVSEEQVIDAIKELHRIAAFYANCRIDEHADTLCEALVRAYLGAGEAETAGRLELIRRYRTD